jgi:hypothetical protein
MFLYIAYNRSSEIGAYTPCHQGHHETNVRNDYIVNAMGMGSQGSSKLSAHVSVDRLID